MNITSEAIQRNARIALQWLAAYLVTSGMIDQNATWVQPAIGFGVAIITYLWTLYGNRIMAKISEVQKLADKTDVSREAKVAIVNVAASLPETEKVVAPDLVTHPEALNNVVAK